MSLLPFANPKKPSIRLRQWGKVGNHCTASPSPNVDKDCLNQATRVSHNLSACSSEQLWVRALIWFAQCLVPAVLLGLTWVRCMWHEAVLKWSKRKFKTQQSEEHTFDSRSVALLAPGSPVWWEVTDWQNPLISQLDKLGIIKKYSRCWKQKEGKRSNEVNGPAMPPSSLTILTTRKLALKVFNTTIRQKLKENNSPLKFITVLANSLPWIG